MRFQLYLLNKRYTECHSFYSAHLWNIRNHKKYKLHKCVCFENNLDPIFIFQKKILMSRDISQKLNFIIFFKCYMSETVCPRETNFGRSVCPILRPLRIHFVLNIALARVLNFFTSSERHIGFLQKYVERKVTKLIVFYSLC